MNRHSLAIRTLLASAVLAGIGALSCSSTEDDPTFDADRGDDLAREMLPEARVLPGSGWEFTETDPDEGDEDGGLSGVCDALEQGIEGLEEEVGDPAGKAAGTYMLPTDDDDPFGIPVEVQVEVEIHEERDAVRRGLATFNELVESDAFEDCLQEAMLQGATEGEGTEGLEIKLETVETSSDAPRGGTEKAFTMAVAFAGVTFEARMEMYAWRIGNAVEFVFISGAEDQVTPQFVESVLDRLDGSAMAAAKSE